MIKMSPSQAGNMLIPRQNDMLANYTANRLAACVYCLCVLVIVFTAATYAKLIRRPLVNPRIRAVGYLRLQWSGVFQWLSPPSAAALFSMALYWTLLTVLSFIGVRSDSLGSREPLAFRVGWVAAAQIPLSFLLAMRWGPLTLLAAAPQARLAWAHRWASLTLIIISTIHGGLFVDQYIKKRVFWMELRLLPTLRDGFYAWGTLAWTAVVSVLPIRRLSHELFILQHIVTAVLFLYFMFHHIGHRNTHLIWVSISIFAVDFAHRASEMLIRNLGRGHGGSMGFLADFSAVEENMTIMTVKKVPFTWKAGQHVYIWMPAVPLQTPHPFTITCLPSPEMPLKVVMRTKAGFTKKINQMAASEDVRLRVFMSGPYGRAPQFNKYDSVVLVSSSTGTSFSTVILESLSHRERVFVLVIVRRRTHLDPYLKALARHAQKASITVAVTNLDIGTEELEEGHCLNDVDEHDAGKLHSDMNEIRGRPSISSYLRECLSEEAGNAVVSVCGGSSLTGDVRRNVSRLALAGINVTLHVEGSK